MPYGFNAGLHNQKPPPLFERNNNGGNPMPQHTKQTRNTLTLSAFWDGIELFPEGRAAAESVLQTVPQAAQMPCNEKLFLPNRFEEGLREVCFALAPDEDGMRLFVYHSRCALHSYALYREKGIADDVYWGTMKFLSRFLEDGWRRSGKMRFCYGHWFPRQLSLREFRLGALEYEMYEEDGENRLSLHIPADADISVPSVLSSVRRARAFFSEYYPAYAAADLYCSSWLLSPALQTLLPAKSRILQFQKLFQILSADHSKAFLEWLYPDPNVPYADLPECTTLQRNAKRLLLEGGTIGWTTGKLIAEP